MRENTVCAGTAGIGLALIAWLGLYGFAWTDYEQEARPAFEALVHGHISSFLRLAPAYGGSLVLRSPFALMTDLWGGGELAVFRMVALPCLLASGALGVYLVARMRANGSSSLARAMTLGVCVVNPITVKALEIGHPEELLGGVLCVAAVLLAMRDKSLWAGVALGAAIANKEWALLAVGPVLLALPPRRWGPCIIAACAVCLVVLGPLLLASSGHFAAGVQTAAGSAGELFQPGQVWWFLGSPNHVTVSHGLIGSMPMNASLSTQPGWRLEPRWLTGLTHPLIIVVALPMTMLAWRRRNDAGAPLLLLSMLLLLRCMLDTWDISYYTLPFIFALLAWQVTRTNRLPLLAIFASFCCWLVFVQMPDHTSPDLQATVFLTLSTISLTAITARLYIPDTLAGLSAQIRAGRHDRQIGLLSAGG